MTRRIICSVFVALLVLLSAIPASAQDDEPPPIYYVRLNDNPGCEDGSEECPFSTLEEARKAGYAQVCEGRIFEVHEWNPDTLEYEYRDSYTGEKPVPPAGLPIALSLQILLVAIAGLCLLVLALYLRGKATRRG